VKERVLSFQRRSRSPQKGTWSMEWCGSLAVGPTGFRFFKTTACWHSVGEFVETLG